MKSETEQQIHPNVPPNKSRGFSFDWDKTKIIKSAVLVVAAIMCLVISITVFPVRHGDGLDYLAMTISIVYHQSPELRQTDIDARKLLLERWPNESWKYIPAEDHTNYFTAQNGKEIGRAHV